MMFPRPTSPFRRGRRPFRRISLGVLIVLACAYWKSHDTLGWWRDTHQQTVRDLSIQVAVDTPNDRFQQRSSHRHHVRWMRSLLNAPNRDTAFMSPLLRKDAGAEKFHGRVAEMGNEGTKEMADGEDDVSIDHVTRSSDSDDVIVDGSETSGRYTSDRMELPLQALHSMNSWSESYRFPDLSECDEVKENADTLPDMVVVPFDDAVMDTELTGWEDLWVSKARYIGPRLAEPKIDFVYNCRWFFCIWSVQH
jgi:hypothetical protein